jgi:excisionase family DNA binding protein
MKPLWNHRQVAEFLGKSPHSIRGMVSRRQIPFIKIGRNCRFDPDRIQNWIQDQAKEPRQSNQSG